MTRKLTEDERIEVQGAGCIGCMWGAIVFGLVGFSAGLLIWSTFEQSLGLGLMFGTLGSVVGAIGMVLLAGKMIRR